ncbi:MAG: ribose-phosphate diphosphokinase [Spirochaetes bacterium]|nr:ribose-phosphate diphosphokinase [Spirochaetota bacterium]
MQKDIKIFAGSSGKVFAQRMCGFLRVPVRPTEVITFSEGNTYVKIGEHVRGSEVYLVQTIGMHANDELMELLFWMDAFKRSGAAYVTAVIPYFSYAKGDKKDEPRVSIRARVCAECIELAGADRLMMMDLHAAQIQGFFKKPVDHLFARPLLTAAIRKMKIPDAVIVSPDAGYAKNARKFAGVLGLPVAIGDKSRKGHDEQAEVLEIIGDVKNKNAIIVDDFSLSAGTIADLSRQLKERGANKVYACLSHAPLSAEGVNRIERSPVEMLITTDSIANPNLKASKKIVTISAAPLFAEAIRRMQNRTSVSDLFESIPQKVLKSALS